MHRMTVGMVETARRKTRFPTVGTTVHTKAKTPSATTAFCIYFILLTGATNSGENTSANRNTYSVAILIIHIPRVEALRTSTLGYEIATPLPFRVALRRAGDRWFRVAGGAYLPP